MSDLDSTTILCDSCVPLHYTRRNIPRLPVCKISALSGHRNALHRWSSSGRRMGAYVRVFRSSTLRASRWPRTARRASGARIRNIWRTYEVRRAFALRFELANTPGSVSKAARPDLSPRARSRHPSSQFREDVIAQPHHNKSHECGTTSLSVCTQVRRVSAPLLGPALDLSLMALRSFPPNFATVRRFSRFRSVQKVQNSL